MKHQRGSRGPALPDPSSVQINGAAVSRGFSDYDQLIELLRDRIAELGLSFRIVEELAQMGVVSVAKYLSDLRIKRLTVESLMRLASVIGVRPVLVVDEKLLRKMRPFYENRDRVKAHPHRRAPIGDVTMRRMKPVVLAELGRLGARARNEALAPEVRSQLSRQAALARWRKSPPA